LKIIRVVDLEGDQRELAVPILIDSFSGIYRWHAKRTLHRVSVVRAAIADDAILGVSMLEELDEGVGYVYYVAVRRLDRRRQVGTILLDDALERFRAGRAAIVYAAVEEANTASLALFRSRGFRPVERDELGYREGGMGARGLRSKMMVVPGEMLLGLRLKASAQSTLPPTLA
jgi:ribosomal protein S18 acetylase RimI-like enzyme